MFFMSMILFLRSYKKFHRPLDSFSMSQYFSLCESNCKLTSSLLQAYIKEMIYYDSAQC